MELPRVGRVDAALEALAERTDLFGLLKQATLNSEKMKRRTNVACFSWLLSSVAPWQLTHLFVHTAEWAPDSYH